MYVNIYLCMRLYIYIYLYLGSRYIAHVYIYNYRSHVGTLREYVCHVGRLKGSMYLVNARLVVRIAAKT